MIKMGSAFDLIFWVNLWILTWDHKGDRLTYIRWQLFYSPLMADNTCWKSQKTELFLLQRSDYYPLHRQYLRCLWEYWVMKTFCSLGVRANENDVIMIIQGSLKIECDVCPLDRTLSAMPDQTHGNTTLFYLVSFEFSLSVFLLCSLSSKNPEAQQEKWIN